MSDALASHMCCDLVVELYKCRIHKGKFFRRFLVCFDLKVEPSNFFAAVVDGVHLLAEESPSWHERHPGQAEKL